MPRKKNERLARKITAIFRQGLFLDRHVIEYIDSTFSPPSFAELKRIISDDTGSERDSLMELIFFPDESIQIQLENILNTEDFQKKDEDEIIRLLGSHKVEAKICIPESNHSILQNVPGAALKQFITRLNITKSLDARLGDAISRHVLKKLQIRVRVRLRHTRFEYTETVIMFLCTFFRTMSPEKENIISFLEFVLALLEERNDDGDIYSFLIKKKRSLAGVLLKARRFEILLEKNNIETLMLQGFRNPCINTTEVLQTMSTIDKISRAVFGKTEDFEHEVEHIMIVENSV